ncbi:hypothetical protein VB712_14130 [Spirulina sp. CCNP1310]|uniref:hypothetical protein n=1 Tax=Spirulina sp. CCNP1310 TaxID=3110249 RepID=UPI002B21DEF6|nr:hypothetical protein [Spirulina sp. CCNP1310]MEA5420366.1 hypothetical protein [Spirulina sp. CCNP1310]
MKQSLKIGAVCVAVGAISLIPVPNNINVGGSLEPKKPDPVYMQVPGTITEFLVEQGEYIDPQGAIARVDTTDLDQEIITKEQRLEEQKRQYTQAIQRLPVLDSRLMETQLATQTAQTQTAILAQRATGEPPEISRLEHEKNRIRQRIQGSHAQLMELQKQYNSTIKILTDYAEVNQKGGGENSVIGGNLIHQQELQKSNFQMLINGKRSEILELQNELDVKDAEIHALRNNWQDEALINAGRTQQTQASEKTVVREYQAVERELIHLQQLVLASESELKELHEKREESRTLTTGKGGWVLTENLNEMRGRKMQQNELILEVADINNLDVVMQVPQVDSPLVKTDGLIKVRFRDAGHGVHTSRIYDIQITFQTDKTEQKQLLIARANLDNPNQTFRPYQEVSVEIIGEKIPLYRKVGLEIRNRINWGKYGIGA